MSWHDLAFLHWRYPPEVIRPLLPDNVELDVFEGSAWVAVVPFRMSNVGVRGLGSIPSISRFAELNVRTYARKGHRTGVWFFSLDAESRPAVEAARVLFRLPYLYARMSCARSDDSIAYASERRDRRGASAIFRARYRPVQPLPFEQRTPLELWLTERYCLFSSDARGRVFAGDIHHRPWPLERGEARIDACSMIEAAGIPPPSGEPLVHFARELDVVAWPIQRIADAPGTARQGRA